MTSQLCENKQKNDEKVKNGKNIELLEHGKDNSEKPINDMGNNRIILIQKNWKKDLDQREKKMKKEIFKESVRAIPIVLYNPHTAVQLLRSTERKKLFFNAINCNDDKSVLSYNNDINTKYDNDNSNGNNNLYRNNYDNNFQNQNQNVMKSLNTNNLKLKHSAEIKYLEVMNSAQNGDKNILYDFFLQNNRNH